MRLITTRPVYFCNLEKLNILCFLVLTFLKAIIRFSFRHKLTGKNIWSIRITITVTKICINRNGALGTLSINHILICLWLTCAPYPDTQTQGRALYYAWTQCLLTCLLPKMSVTQNPHSGHFCVICEHVQSREM